MKLSRNHLLVRWAYIDKFIFKDADHPVPAQTDLCSLITRAIFVPPSFFVFLSMMAAFLIVASPFLFIEWLSKKYGWDQPKPKGVLAQRWEDWREKKCTRIEIGE